MFKQTRSSETSTISLKFLNAKSALTQTIQKILDLNKSLRRSQKTPENQEIKRELRLLNKVADQQAKIVQLYEYELQLKRASNQ